MAVAPSTAPSARNAVANLTVPLIPQQTPKWCWAASGQMIMTYLGHPVPQCEQVNHYYGHNDCCNHPTPDGCVKGGWPEFDHWGFSFRSFDGPLTWGGVRREIDSNRPIAFSWRWIGGNHPPGGGHVMVVRGYNTTDPRWVYVNDPWYPNIGEVRAITYRTYVNQPKDHTHWRDYFQIRWTGPAGDKPEEALGPGEREELMDQQDAPGGGNDLGDPQAAAQASLELFAELVTRDTAQEMGFEGAPIDPDRLSLGEPLRDFTIPLGEVRAYQEGTDIGEILNDTDQLFYPVLMDGQVVSSVTVAKQDDQWAPVSLGSPNLTKDVAEARDSSAARTGKAPAEYFIVRIPALYAIFVAHRDEAGKVQFTHVLEEEPRPGVDRYASEPGEDVVKRLQAQLPAPEPEAAPVVPF